MSVLQKFGCTKTVTIKNSRKHILKKKTIAPIMLKQRTRKKIILLCIWRTKIQEDKHEIYPYLQSFSGSQ